MSLESTGARAEQLAGQILVFGRPIPIDEMITPRSTASAATTLPASQARLAGRPPDRRGSTGPVDELPSYGDLAARFG